MKKYKLRDKITKELATCWMCKEEFEVTERFRDYQLHCGCGLQGSYTRAVIQHAYDVVPFIVKKKDKFEFWKPLTWRL